MNNNNKAIITNATSTGNGEPQPRRRYPAETGSEGYTLSERTLGQWLEHWAETTPDREYIVYSDRNLRFTWKQFNERVDNLAKGLLAIGVEKGSNVGISSWNISAKTQICTRSASPTAHGTATTWI